MHPVRSVAWLAIVVVAGGLLLADGLLAHAQATSTAGGKTPTAGNAAASPVSKAAIAGDAAATPASKAPKIPAGTAAAVLGKDKAQAILGDPVVSTKGQNMGRIVDVIVDKKGTPRAAIIDFGGFLGVGSRKIAVAWNELHFSPAGKAKQITLDLTRDQLKSAPAYEKGKPVVVLKAKGKIQPMPIGEYPLDQ
jgi:PRC-barrel domain